MLINIGLLVFTHVLRPFYSRIMFERGFFYHAREILNGNTGPSCNRANRRLTIKRRLL